MKIFHVTTAGATEQVHADLLTFEPSGHVAFYERQRGAGDRLVLAVHAATVVEEASS